MTALARLAGFVAVLAMALGVSFGVGNAVGPVVDEGQDSSHSGGHGMDNDHDHRSQQPESQGYPPGGLAVSQDGYTLQLEETELEAGTRTVTFQIANADGDPVTKYVPNHQKDLHLIAVRRDATGFQHLHPTRDDSGTWSTQVDLTAGTWRIFADFQPEGTEEPITLGADAHVAGEFTPKPTPAPGRTSTVGDYTVTLDGELAPGKARDLSLQVTRDGKPVTDLDPYLGAYGHLVALRSSDLAYLHVHPEGEPDDSTTKAGPDLTFTTTAPSAGTYRLYLDFKHGGTVRTAEFTVTASAGPGTAPASPSSSGSAKPSGDHGNHDH